MKQDWYTRDMAYREEINRKEIKEILSAEMQEEVKEKFCSKYCTIPPEDWTDLFETFEARNDSRNTSCAYQKPDSKKKNSENPDGDDANSKSIPKIPHNKHKPNHGNGKQQKDLTLCVCYFTGFIWGTFGH